VTNRQRLVAWTATFGVCCAGLTATAVAFGAASATHSRPAREGVHAVKTVTVTMTDFKFKLSSSKVPVGTVIFKVVNKGKIAHDFKINGKKTPVLAPGKSATLRVTFKAKKSYAYICTIAGHAAAGMKGSLGVGVAPTPTPTPAPTPGGGGGSTPAQCASPQTTTVQVNEFDFGFTLSPAGSIPCGQVTFVQKNTGAVIHNFSIDGVNGATGALINPGQSTTMTVTIGPGKYQYVCDVPGHVAQGMSGQLTVTGE
jgi:uncharacterized cupredoxin-like copper-binding protein